MQKGSNTKHAHAPQLNILNYGKAKVWSVINNRKEITKHNLA